MAAFIAVITGNFKGFLLFTLIIIIHELGHILAALFYKWHIEKVLLLPFGALTIFHEKINKPLKEEFIILIMGPLFQLIGTYFLVKFYGVPVLDYSLAILSFNLLPIYPLDGAKFLNIILNKIISFKRSHLLTIYISFLTIIILLLKIKYNLLIVLIIVFVAVKVYLEYKDHNNIFNLFLLERYNNDFNFKKHKNIKSLNYAKMKRDYKHLFKEKGKYITEKEALKKRFDFKSKM